MICILGLGAVLLLPPLPPPSFFSPAFFSPPAFPFMRRRRASLRPSLSRSSSTSPPSSVIASFASRISSISASARACASSTSFWLGLAATGSTPSLALAKTSAWSAPTPRSTKSVLLFLSTLSSSRVTRNSWIRRSRSGSTGGSFLPRPPRGPRGTEITTDITPFGWKA